MSRFIIGLLLILGTVFQPLVSYGKKGNLIVSGPVRGVPFTTSTYTVTVPWGTPNHANYTFSVSNGTIIEQNTSTFVGQLYCIVQWNDIDGGGYVTIDDNNNADYGEIQVRIGYPIAGGTIGCISPYYNNSVSIAAISELAPASGGYCFNSYIYHWESSLDGVNWTTFASVSRQYPLTAPAITSHIYIRRFVECDGDYAASNTIEFTYRAENWENRNFIRSNEIWYPGIFTFDAADRLPIGQKQQNTVYFDGLGRSEQSVIMQGSPTQKDLVTPIEYDAIGREVKKHLAYQAGTGDGKFKEGALAAQQVFMGDPTTGKYPGESHFYAETQLENSPLNRTLKTLAPGQNWGGSNEGIGAEYDLNAPGEAIRIWRIDPFAIGAIPVSDPGDIYGDYTLYKTTTTDEQDRKIIDYKDAEGRCILKKQQEQEPGSGLTEAHAGWMCTYYVYDDMGRLRFTITPKAVAQMDLANNWVISQAVANGLCYTYAYDNRGRLIDKKLPDAAPVRMVYDARDRLVLSQDGNQAAGVNNPSQYKEWTFFTYDAHDKQVFSGTLSESSNHTRAALQTAVDNLSPAGNVTVTIQTDVTESLTINRPLPIFPGISSLITYQNFKVNGVTYYDAKNASLFTPVSLSYASNFENVEAPIPSNRTTGLQTGSKARVMDGGNTFLVASTIYDEKGRVLQTRSKNVAGWDLTLTKQYDFSGKVRSSKFTDYHQTQTALGPPYNYTVYTDYITEILSKDEFDHVGRHKRSYKNLHRKSGNPVEGPAFDFATGEKLVAEYDYDELGQLKTKTLAPGYDGPNGAWMEKLNYSYNIRGWMTGINKGYVSNNSPSQYFFGMEIGYDKPGDAGFTNSFLNGNVAGVAWKTAGNNMPRKYDFQYDVANRLASANFNQRDNFSSPSNWSKTTFDFSVPVVQYDLNGNITRMEQQGVTFSGIVPMDKMDYGYSASSNKLEWVSEDVSASDYKLGDFTDKNAGDGNADYIYDENGNVTEDKNRGISKIRYNYLNLPEQIDFTGKGTIKYIYDAGGNKLRKEVIDNTPSTGTITKQLSYSGPITYDEAGIAVGFEEGRARIPSILSSTQFVFDYFVKDNMGNVRMVLTEETETKAYPAATMETGTATYEEQYYNITDRSDKPIELQNNQSYTDRYGLKMSKLTNLSGGKKVGPSILLKVMAGDVLQAKTDYYYKDNGTQVNGTSLLNDLATNLLAHLALGQAGAAAKSQAATIESNALTDGVVGGLITDQNNGYNANRPKAYLNYIVFDEQMKALSKGTLQVQNNGPLQAPLVLSDIEIEKNGWIYVFANNESQQSVYFDNFQVTHTPGNILEETHYYPFGLTMKAISSKALGLSPINRNKYNNKELQNEEFSDGSGFEEYDYGSRFYDPQIGRWHSLDPMADDFMNVSPYSYGSNNPNTYKDKDGKFIQFIIQYGINVGINVATQMLTAYMFDPSVKSWGDAWDKVSMWDAFWEGGVDMIGSKKLQMAINGVTQMFTYIDQVGLKNVTTSGLLGSGLVGILEPIVGDAIGKYGIGAVTKGLQKLGIDGNTINRLLGRSNVPMCFAAGTKILTQDGLMNIEDIRIGVMVWSYNDTTGTVQLKSVESINKKRSDHLRVIVVNNEPIYTTKDHPFFIQLNWKNASEVAKGDTLTLFKNQRVIVDSAYTIDTTVDVYNFSVVDFHTYYVSKHSILVHNSIPCHITDKIKSITKNWTNFQCKECASDIISMLKKEGIKGDKISLKAKGNRHFIVSDKHGADAVSTNGEHVGVLIEGVVYDNIHKEGIKLADWLNDFHSAYGFDVFKTPF
jgi:RHS repeat-associated protein